MFASVLVESVVVLSSLLMGNASLFPFFLMLENAVMFSTLLAVNVAEVLMES